LSAKKPHAAPLKSDSQVENGGSEAFFIPYTATAPETTGC